MNTIALFRALRSLFSPWSKSRSLDRAADEIVAECQASLSQALRRSTTAMSRDEARGYARAYAVQFVSGEIDDALRRHRLGRGHRNQLLLTAVNRLVSTVTRDRVESAATYTRPLAA